jgi:uncharacterized protein (DUF362 family)
MPGSPGGGPWGGIAVAGGAGDAVGVKANLVSASRPASNASTIDLIFSISVMTL